MFFNASNRNRSRSDQQQQQQQQESSTDLQDISQSERNALLILQSFSEHSSNNNNNTNNSTDHSRNEGIQERNHPQNQNVHSSSLHQNNIDVETVEEASANNVPFNSNSNNNNNNNMEDVHPTEDENNDDNDAENTIISLTRRLRCLFGVITWPIVPLGTVVTVALFYFLYAAAFLDVAKECSHPIKAYAVTTVVLAAYSPYHAYIRERLFQYRRDRDGPHRPLIVRRYDQIIHTAALLYVYAGITLVETCREDLSIINLEEYQEIPNGNAADINQTHNITESRIKVSTSNVSNELDNIPDIDAEMNSCRATCPNLTAALTVYVATLELFTLSLILPLLFLPCIYLWFLRQATANQEALAVLQERLREEEESLLLHSNNSTPVTAEEILKKLQIVKLVRKRNDNHNHNNNNKTPKTKTNNGIDDEKDAADDDQDEMDDEVWIVPLVDDNDANDGSNHHENDDDSTAISISGAKDFNDVKECCICMCDFYIYDENNTASATTNHDIETGHSDTTTNNDNNIHQNNSNNNINTNNETIVRTLSCGHLFHKRCISSWVGGRWQMSQTNGARNRARRTTCPLCRQDLRSSNPDMNNNNNSSNSNNNNNNYNTFG